LSGVLALGFGWWGQQEALLHVADLAGPIRLAIVLAIQPIAIASIAGGLAILVYPAVGRAAMLASAVGWLVLVAIVGGGVTLPAALLIALSAGGGLLGLLPSLKDPVFRIQRAGQQDRRDVPPLAPMRNAPSPMPSRFEAVATRQRPAEPPRPAPPPARLAQVRPGSYFPTFDTMEGPFSSPTLPTLGEEDHSQPFVAPADEQADAWRPYFPETAGRGDEADEDEDHSQPFVAVEPADDYERSYVQSEPSFSGARGNDRRSYDFRSSGLAPLADKPRRKPTKRGRARATAGMAALVLIIIGAPALLVLDAQMRTDGQIKPASLATTPGPTEKQKPASTERQARLVPQAPLKISTVPPALEAAVGPQPTGVAADQFASLAPPTAADAAPVTTPASLPMPAGPPYASIGDYCVALGTSDAPDVNKITGGLLPSVVAAIHKTTSKPAGEVYWRCMDRAVWVCVAPKGEVACDREPTAVDRSLFCAAHPNAYGVHTAGGDWSCDGFTPVLPKGPASVADRRGYDTAAWVLLPASAAAATG